MSIIYMYICSEEKKRKGKDPWGAQSSDGKL
jgi:hypothetical protein